MLVRTFTCPTCAAAGETDGKALVVMCRYCGSFVGIDPGAVYAGDGFAVTGRRLLCGNGTIEAARAQERLTTIWQDLAGAATSSDREGWRRLSFEYHSLLAICHPELVPTDTAGRRDWLVSAVAFAELGAFEPAVAAAMRRYNELASTLQGAADPVAVARTMLAAAVDYFRTALSHPEFPPGVATEGADHHAREMVRQSVASLAMVLGEVVVGTIRHDLLGDDDVAGPVRCRNCGATVDRFPCPHCGGAASVEADDPWLTQTLAIFRVSLDELAARGALDGQEPVLGALAYVFVPRQSGGMLSPALAAEFVRRAVPWVTHEHLAAGIETYRSMYEPGSDDARFLDELIAALEPWQPNPSRRPAPPAPVNASATEAGPDDPWVVQALALWKLGMGTVPGVGADAVVSFCLAPFFHDAPISVSQGRHFIAQAAPTIPPAEVARAAASFRTGFDDGLPVASFLDGLVDAFRPS